MDASEFVPSAAVEAEGGEGEGVGCCVEGHFLGMGGVVALFLERGVFFWVLLFLGFVGGGGGGGVGWGGVWFGGGRFSICLKGR